MYGKGNMILEKIEFQVKDAYMKEHKLLKLEKHANFAQYFKMHNILQKHFPEICTPIKWSSVIFHVMLTIVETAAITK